MWICTNVGFVSVVQSDKDPMTFKVRARRRKHLETLFPNHTIQETENTDYKYRVFVDRVEMANTLKEWVMDIDYGNFKNSVEDDDLHHLYEKFWVQHYRYQR